MRNIFITKSAETLEIVFPAKGSIGIEILDLLGGIKSDSFILLLLFNIHMFMLSLGLMIFESASLIINSYYFNFSSDYFFVWIILDSILCIWSLRWIIICSFGTIHLRIHNQSITFSQKFLGIQALSRSLSSPIFRKNICMLVSTAVSYKLINLKNQEEYKKEPPSLIIWEGIQKHDLRKYLNKDLTLIERDRIAQEISNFLGIAITSENLSGITIPLDKLSDIKVELPRIPKPIGSDILFTKKKDTLEVIIPCLSNFSKLEINQRDFYLNCSASNCQYAKGLQDNRHHILNLLSINKIYKQFSYKHKGGRYKGQISTKIKELSPDLFICTQHNRYRLGSRLTLPEHYWLAQELSEFLNVPIIWE
ncbi:hypothetical protein I8752_33275 [Nostocaceae cyanobacterium CENA369]|uniref:Uncharacterized protein n=1 Tax=Dendronalium phyllosphericum CENA369 TaxID=1725256 RepID=A0A8J7LJJ8_9NOST|nr:hypothetical protein [Dendronalium phyllosphericum]MBH8577753.1 hypothetical protein [Dendronalium phyllosphericum CENA369]